MIIYTIVIIYILILTFVVFHTCTCTTYSNLFLYVVMSGGIFYAQISDWVCTSLPQQMEWLSYNQRFIILYLPNLYHSQSGLDKTLHIFPDLRNKRLKHFKSISPNSMEAAVSIPTPFIWKSPPHPHPSRGIEGHTTGFRKSVYYFIPVCEPRQLA